MLRREAQPNQLDAIRVISLISEGTFVNHQHPNTWRFLNLRARTQMFVLILAR